MAAATSKELVVSNSFTTSIEIMNIGTGVSTFDCLSSYGTANSIVINDQDYYISGYQSVNRFNINQKKWTLASIPFTNRFIFNVGNDLYGITNDSDNSFTGAYKIYRISF